MNRPSQDYLVSELIDYALYTGLITKEEAEAAALAMLREQLRGFRITDERTETDTGRGDYVYATAHAEYTADLCRQQTDAPQNPPALPE